MTDGWFFVLQIWMVTFALNSAKKSKCFLRSVARMASMTKKRKRLNSTCSRLTRKLNSGRDMKRFHAEAAWWFSKTERSLYRTAYSGRPRGERNIETHRSLHGLMYHCTALCFVFSIYAADACSRNLSSHQCINCDLPYQHHITFHEQEHRQAMLRACLCWKGLLSWSVNVYYVDYWVSIYQSFIRWVILCGLWRWLVRKFPHSCCCPTTRGGFKIISVVLWMQFEVEVYFCRYPQANSSLIAYTLCSHKYIDFLWVGWLK